MYQCVVVAMRVLPEIPKRIKISFVAVSIALFMMFPCCFVYSRNVKQIFVMVTAEYTTPSNQLNQVVVWDAIIESPEDAKLS